LRFVEGTLDTIKNEDYGAVRPRESVTHGELVDDVGDGVPCIRVYEWTGKNISFL
jgi:hypothetical protein